MADDTPTLTQIHIWIVDGWQYWLRSDRTATCPVGKTLRRGANHRYWQTQPSRGDRKEFGANQAFLVADTRGLRELRVAQNERGVDVAFEAAGEQGAVDDAFTAVRAGGKVILAGIPEDDRTSFPASTARRKGLTIKLVRRMKHTYPRAIDLVSKGLVDVRSLVTHRVPLERALDAFQVAAQREGLKVIIEI